MPANMGVDKIKSNDPRIVHKEATLNGHKYHYLLAIPENGQFKATIFLVHGWPDLAFGWRYQITFLMANGFRVVAMDMMGYGGTEAPKSPPESMHLYGHKRAADDIAALAKELNAPRIVLGGHDWGGMVVYRTAQWHPQLVTHVFSVCTAFFPIRDDFRSTEDTVAILPQFGYQLQLKGPEVESNVQTPEQIKQFLKGLYGGRPSGGGAFFRKETGADLSILDTVGMTPLLNEEELDYYVKQYSRTGFHGPCNWYRTGEANFEDEKRLSQTTLDQPTLYILATQDDILTRELSLGMEAYVSKLSRREVTAGHWALWQTPAEVNRHIQEWLDTVVFGAKSVL